MTELEETRAALRDLYWQLYGRPAKHPQQLEQRKRAAALLGITQPEISDSEPRPAEPQSPQRRQDTRSRQ